MYTYLMDIFPLEVKDVGGPPVECRTPPVRPFIQSSLPLQHRSSYILSTFCTEDNVQECLFRISQVGHLKHFLLFLLAQSSDSRTAWRESGFAPSAAFHPPLSVTQEVTSLGLPPVWSESGGGSETNVVAVLNRMHDLVQLYHRSLRSLETLEVEQHKSSSNVDYLQLTSARLKVESQLLNEVAQKTSSSWSTQKRPSLTLWGVFGVVGVERLAGIGRVCSNALLCCRSSLRYLKEKTRGSWRENEGCNWKQRVCNIPWKMRRKRYIFFNELRRWHYGGFEVLQDSVDGFLSVFPGAKTSEHHCEPGQPV